MAFQNSLLPSGYGTVMCGRKEVILWGGGESSQSPAVLCPQKLSRLTPGLSSTNQLVFNVGLPLRGAPVLPKCNWASLPETGGQQWVPDARLRSRPASLRESTRVPPENPYHCRPGIRMIYGQLCPHPPAARPGKTGNVFPTSPPPSFQSGAVGAGGACSCRFFVVLIFYPMEPGVK